MSDKGMHLRVQWSMPFADDSEFEEFIEHYFNAKEQTDSFQLFGRKGQKTTWIRCFLGSSLKVGEEFN